MIVDVIQFVMMVLNEMMMMMVFNESGDDDDTIMIHLPFIHPSIYLILAR